MEAVNRYRITDRDRGREILASIRDELIRLSLYREFALLQKSGGRSGDLGEETMEYEVHVSGHEGGYSVGSVHIYSVIDNTGNGFAHLFSVIIHLPDGEEKQLVLALLDQLEFVPKYSSFGEQLPKHRNLFGVLV